MILVTKHCSMCLKNRKFVEGSARDYAAICGDCWDWGNSKNEPIDKVTGTITPL